MSSSASASDRLRRAWAAAALAALLVWGGVRAAAAQEPAAAVVERVAVEVDGRPGEAGLLDLIPIRAGDALSARRIDQAVKQIYATGLFADVRVSRTGEERVALVFALTRNVFIDAVRFRGAKASAARLAAGLTVLRPGAYLQEDLVAEAVAEVRAALREEGFFAAAVACDILYKPGSTADLVFRTSDWKSYRVGGLEVEWQADIPESAVLRKMRTKVGDVYVPNRLAADLAALSDGLGRLGYRRAEVALAGEVFDETNGRVDLRVVISPQEKITVVINGAKVPPRLIEPIWEERVFEQWGLDEGDVRILNHLRRKGYLYASVESRVEHAPDEVRIVHDVAPGERASVKTVDFRGLTAFSSLDMKTRLAIREGVPFFSLLKYDRLFQMPREIEAYYRESGYADVQVRLELVREKEGVRAVLDVREGSRVTVGDIRVEGTKLFPGETLLRELVSRAGGPYYPPNVQRDVGEIETFYLNRGVRGTSVAARVEPAGDGRVILVYAVEEGSPVTVRNVFVTGNRTTRMGVIGREIRVAPGGAAEYAKVQETKRRLDRLGIFSDVRVDEVQTGPGDEVVVVTVREGEKNYTGLGLGFESLTPLTGSLAAWPSDFRPRGTAEYIRSNVFGLGAQAGVLGQISTRERRAVLSWNQPYLFGLSMPTTVLGWLEREARESFTLDRRGVSLSAVKSLSKARLLLASLSLTRTALKDVDLDDLPEDIDRQFLPYSAALASVSMSWERRDDTLNPTKGYFFSAVGEWGVPVFGMESDYQKVFFKFQLYRPVVTGLNLGLTARLGLGNGLRHLPERFFAGGSNTFRGEEFEMLGPTDETTLKPYGGEAVLLVNAEMSFAVVPSWREMRLAAFFDLGNVYATLGEFRPFDLRGAAGAGIRYRTPLGPVRVEIAWKLWGFDAQDRRGRPLIFLTIGHIF
jgi:outer membrane protein insertion porin family